MLFKSNTSIDHFLLKTQHILNFLAGNATVLASLTRYGFSAAQLQAGNSLLQQTQTANLAYQQALQKQISSTKMLHADRNQANQHHLVLRNAMRRALIQTDESELTNQPFLYSSRKGYADWLLQLEHFYETLLNHPTYQEKLATFGIPSEQLTHGRQLVEAVAADKTAQTESRYEVLQARNVRDNHLNALKAWFDELMSIARTTFRQQPETLNALDTLPATSAARIKRRQRKSDTGKSDTEGGLEAS